MTAATAHTSLTDRRPWLSLGIVAALAYLFRDQLMLPGLAAIVLKGSVCSFFALYAWRWRNGGASSPTMRDNAFVYVTVMMAFSAVGDAVIELSIVWGGAAFALSHAVAIVFYRRNARQSPTGSQRGAAIALLAVTPSIAWFITHDYRLTIYAVILGAMAASAWLSRFPRYRVGAGAILFVISDMILFHAVGRSDPNTELSALVWPIYVTGQFLIVTGLVQTLRRWQANQP